MEALSGFGLLECGVERLKKGPVAPEKAGEVSAADRAKLFPVTREGIFLAHAAVAPISGPAQEAMNRWADGAAQGHQEDEQVWRRVRRAREVSARFLGCEWDEVSLLGPTALGLGLVALGLDWKEGDEVIYDPLDYPANVYPWRDLARRGVRPVPLERGFGEKILWSTLSPKITSKTKLVSLATAHYLSGLVPELSVIGPELKGRKILLCLDGIQTLGVMPTEWAEADFLAADAHKWMLGPVGAGVLMVRKRVWDRMSPPLLGSWNVVSPDYLAQSTMVVEGGGRRYEPGSLNLPGIEGMRASLELLEQLGRKETSEHVLGLAERIREGARRGGFSIYGQGEEARPITSLLEPTRGWKEVPKKMEAARIRVSWRREHEGRMLLRVSPHRSNTRAEVDEFLKVLGSAG